MADRYWVGGGFAWNDIIGTKWATTSGGVGGASIPTSSDDVYFDANSGAVNVRIEGVVNCRSLICTGFTGVLSGHSLNNGNLRVHQDIILDSTMGTGSGLDEPFGRRIGGDIATLSLVGLTTHLITSNGVWFSWGGATGTELVDGGTAKFVDDFTTNCVFNLNDGCTLDFNNNNLIIPAGAVSGRLVVTGAATVDFTANGSIIVFRGTISNTITFQPPFTAQFLGSKNVSVRITSSQLFQIDAPFPSNTLESYALNYVSSSLNASIFRFTVANNLDWSLGVGGLQAAQEQNYIFGDFLRNSAPGDVSKVPSGDCSVYFAASSGTKTINCSNSWAGISLIFAPSNSSVTYNLTSNIVQSSNTKSTFTLNSSEAATLNTNNNTITTNGFYAVNKGNINLGSSVINVRVNNLSSPVVFASFAPDVVLNAGTSTIKAISGSGELIAANKTLHNVELATTGTITIPASSPNTTINTLSNSVTPAAITFPSGATTTINNFNLVGSGANKVTIRSTTAGQRATIAKTSGTVDAVSLDVQSSIATGGATWQANLVTNGNIDSGNNVGWNFFKGSMFQFLEKP